MYAGNPRLLKADMAAARDALDRFPDPATWMCSETRTPRTASTPVTPLVLERRQGAAYLEQPPDTRYRAWSSQPMVIGEALIYDLHHTEL